MVISFQRTKARLIGSVAVRSSPPVLRGKGEGRGEGLSTPRGVALQRGTVLPLTPALSPGVPGSTGGEGSEVESGSCLRQEVLEGAAHDPGVEVIVDDARPSGAGRQH